MDANQINDIEVNDHTDVTSINWEEIDEARNLLKDRGYYTDNLWMTEDVKMNYHCTESEAQEILDAALNNEATFQQIWDAISYEANSMKIIPKD